MATYHVSSLQAITHCDARARARTHTHTHMGSNGGSLQERTFYYYYPSKMETGGKTITRKLKRMARSKKQQQTI